MCLNADLLLGCLSRCGKNGRCARGSAGCPADVTGRSAVRFLLRVIPHAVRLEGGGGGGGWAVKARV